MDALFDHRNPFAVPQYHSNDLLDARNYDGDNGYQHPNDSRIKKKVLPTHEMSFPVFEFCQDVSYAAPIPMHQAYEGHESYYSPHEDKSWQNSVGHATNEGNPTCLVLDLVGSATRPY